MMSFSDNPFLPPFQKIPLTLRDQAKNVSRFLSNKENRYLSIRRHVFSSLVVQEILKSFYHKHYTEKSKTVVSIDQFLDRKLINFLTEKISKIALPTINQRSFIGIASIDCHVLVNTPFMKTEPVYDSDGNKSLVNVAICLSYPYRFLQDPMVITTYQKHYSIQDFTKLALVYDNQTSFSHNILEGKFIFLQAKLLYSLLPDRAYMLSDLDQQMMWRGSMKRTFTNTFSYSGEPPKHLQFEKISINDNLLEEQCESCLHFIPIDSESCPLCSDKLISNPVIISSRKQGLWISN